MRSMMKRTLGTIATLAALTLTPNLAHTAEIKVLTVGSLRIAFEDHLTAAYERASGNTLNVSFNNPALIDEMVVAQDFDVIIAAVTSVNMAAAAGLLQPDTQMRLARTGIGMSIREGAPAPDISTPEAFRNTLLSAESIALSNPDGLNGSGVQTVKILGYAGVYDQVMAKGTIQGLGAGKELIAKGERDLGLFNISEATAPGVVYIGPVPDVWQLYTDYHAAILADSIVKPEAADLIAFLAAATAEPGWNAGGIELTLD